MLPSELMHAATLLSRRRYERLKRQEWRYDGLDVVGHVYRSLLSEGYTGTPLHVLYRDECQDFAQGELLLDMAVVQGEA